MRLKDKIAVITGAAGDIGTASARRFLEEGAQIALIDRDQDGLAATSKSLGGTPLLIGADITDEAALAAAADTVASKFGKIDILFANAGIEHSFVSVTDMTKDTFERVIGVNLTGAFLTAKYFVPVIADDGSIIITSSIAGLIGYPAYSAYSASKAGLIGLMRSVSLDVASRRIRCNTIHPGPVRSKMLERSALEATAGGDVEAWFSDMAKTARMGRLVAPADVAGLALFLASDESCMITGQSIVVDGGIVE